MGEKAGLTWVANSLPQGNVDRWGLRHVREKIIKSAGPTNALIQSYQPTGLRD